MASVANDVPDDPGAEHDADLTPERGQRGGETAAVKLPHRRLYRRQGPDHDRRGHRDRGGDDRNRQAIDAHVEDGSGGVEALVPHDHLDFTVFAVAKETLDVARQFPEPVEVALELPPGALQRAAWVPPFPFQLAQEGRADHPGVKVRTKVWPTTSIERIALASNE